MPRDHQAWLTRNGLQLRCEVEAASVRQHDVDDVSSDVTCRGSFPCFRAARTQNALEREGRLALPCRACLDIVIYDQQRHHDTNLASTHLTTKTRTRQA
jgi:hypothetical protein